MTPELYGLLVGAASGFGIGLFLICCLKCCGFGGRGVRGGSYASGWHSSIGDVESGSCFSCE